MNKYLAPLLLVLYIALSGCAGTGKMAAVSKDSVGLPWLGKSSQTNVFTLTPERRTVIVVRLDPREVTEWKGQKPFKFCAEPPPDVAEGIANTFKALIETAAKLEKIDAKATMDISRAINTSVTSLFRRTQGVQFFRDGLYALCQANMNGAIKDEQYEKFLDQLMQMANGLISQEIPLIPKGASPAVAEPGPTPTSGSQGSAPQKAPPEKVK